MNSINKTKINEETSNKPGILGSRIVLPNNYAPTDIEEYMNESQLEFFRQKLLIWKHKLLNEASDTKDDLSEEEKDETVDLIVISVIMAAAVAAAVVYISGVSVDL